MSSFGKLFKVCGDVATQESIDQANFDYYEQHTLPKLEKRRASLYRSAQILGHGSKTPLEPSSDDANNYDVSPKNDRSIEDYIAHLTNMKDHFGSECLRHEGGLLIITVERDSDLDRFIRGELIRDIAPIRSKPKVTTEEGAPSSPLQGRNFLLPCYNPT